MTEPTTEPTEEFLERLPEIPCPRCNAPFTPVQFKALGFRCFEPTRYCEPCLELFFQEENLKWAGHEADSAAAAKLARWRKLCPEEYDNTDTERLPEKGRAKLPSVLAWTFGPKGLILAGNSGSGKTRMMMLKLKELFDLGFSIRVIGAASFRAQASAAAKECKLDDWISELVKVDVLMLDDLGQMTMTDSAEEALLAVVEGRTANRKPILATTQYKREEFIAQFSRENRGTAVYRRLSEFSHAIGV